MLPHQRNKVDISKLTPDEQKAFRMYGKLPSRPMARTQERKYFDSGDHALAKAGKVAMSSLGRDRPTPDAIPHAAKASEGASSTPAAGSPGIPAAQPMSFGTPLGIPTAPGTTPATPMSIGSPPTSSGLAGPSSLSFGRSSLMGAETSEPADKAGSTPANTLQHHPMSPGRVGVGQGTTLAASPTRAMGSFPIQSSLAAGASTSPTSSTVSKLEKSAANISPGTGSMGTPPVMVSATTGNQVGRVQIRRSSDSETSATSTAAAASSGLAQSYTADDHAEQVDAMELH